MQDLDLWDTHHARRAEYDRTKRVATGEGCIVKYWVDDRRERPATLNLFCRLLRGLVDTDN